MCPITHAAFDISQAHFAIWGNKGRYCSPGAQLRCAPSSPPAPRPVGASKFPFLQGRRLESRGAPHSQLVHGQRSHQATGLCGLRVARTSMPSGQHKSLGVLGRSPLGWLRAADQQRSRPAWETRERGGILLHCLKAEFKLTTPGMSLEVRHSHSSRDGVGHTSLCRCAHLSVCKREGAG